MAEAKPKAGGRSRFRVRNPRAPKDGAAKPKARATKAKAKASEATTRESKVTAAKEAAKGTPAKTTRGRKKPPPDIEGRIDGLRGWLEEIERRQGRMTYFGAAGLLIAIAAAGAALYFGITTHNDAATKDDLDEVKAEITTLKAEVAKANQGKQSLNQTLTSLQQQLKSIQAKQQATDQQIASLRKQAASTPPASSLPTPGVTPPATTTP